MSCFWHQFVLHLGFCTHRCAMNIYEIKASGPISIQEILTLLKKYLKYSISHWGMEASKPFSTERMLISWAPKLLSYCNSVTVVLTSWTGSGSGWKQESERWTQVFHMGDRDPVLQLSPASSWDVDSQEAGVGNWSLVWNADPLMWDLGISSRMLPAEPYNHPK